MPFKAIIFQRKEAVAEVVLHRPGAGNSINLLLAQELREICQQINQDRDIRAVIFTGSGDHFSTGSDLEEMEQRLRSQLAPDEVHRLAESYSVASPVASLLAPTIAAINGDALGQGLELALSCDLRIVSEEAHLGLPCVALGLLPMDGGSQRLPRLISRGKALEMLLTTRTITAEEALRLGLVSKVVPRGKVLPEAETLAREIAAMAPLALRFAKEAVNKGLDLPLEQGLRLEADLYFLLHTTEDRTEGITAFKAKKPPKFKGR